MRSLRRRSFRVECQRTLIDLDAASPSNILPQLQREPSGRREGGGDPGDAGAPSELIEKPAQHGGADQAAAEIAGEIDATGYDTVVGGSLSDELVAAACAKKVPIPTITMPASIGPSCAVSNSGRPSPATMRPTALRGCHSA